MLFEKTIERRHQGGVSDALFKGEINIAHTYFPPFPCFIKDGTLELPQRERHDFVGTTKTAKKKSRLSHSQVFCFGGGSKSISHWTAASDMPGSRTTAIGHRVR